jgi:O-antigen/teichoic acid export membrane protein
LNLLLIPKYGAVGASVATSIAYTPYVILNWLEVKKVLDDK